jgi:hypothetical protein
MSPAMMQQAFASSTIRCTKPTGVVNGCGTPARSVLFLLMVYERYFFKKKHRLPNQHEWIFLNVTSVNNQSSKIVIDLFSCFKLD